jgi:predicted nuclease of predicted toxin-antitoxin system
MARIYTNENFRYSIVIKLRELGNDVLTALEAGNANQSIPDESVLEFAIKENRILLTFNRQDFIKLHYQFHNHKGIIICSLDPNAEGQANRIHQAILQENTLDGKLIRVNKPNI